LRFKNVSVLVTGDCGFIIPGHAANPAIIAEKKLKAEARYMSTIAQKTQKTEEK
jgi:hypothetical protein